MWIIPSQEVIAKQNKGTAPNNGFYKTALTQFYIVKKSFVFLFLLTAVLQS